MNKVYLLTYNNYYNRIVKKFNTIEGYSDYIEDSLTLNFIPGDGVTTTQVMNGLQNDGVDYLIVCDNETDVILSRWFIIDTIRKSGSQYLLNLKRDSVADNYDEIIKAPVFIEKATLNDSDPFIYNRENMSYNQIKKSETLLKDESETPWLVGYISRNENENRTFNISTYYDKSYPRIEDYPFYEYIGNQVIKKYQDGKGLFYSFDMKPSNASSVRYIVDAYKNIITENIIDNTNINFTTKTADFLRETIRENLQELVYPNLSSDFAPSYLKANEGIFYALMNENGKIIKIDNTYYKVNIIQSSQKIEFNYPDMGSNPSIFGNQLTGENISSTFKSKGIYNDMVLNVTIEEQGQNLFTASVDFSKTRTKCSDEPFDMFCIPLFNFGYEYPTGQGLTSILYTYQNNNIAVMTGIASLGNIIYDAQILPYCPLLITPTTNHIDLTTLNDEDYQPILNGTNIINFIIWVSRAKFTKMLDYQITINDIKVENETSLWRLNSPNYSGAFDFNASKNITIGTSTAVSSFKVDCEYKPYTPYIHVAPMFNNLYGSDFNDARGLICGGDFSLATVTDNWTQYQINNKNYLNSFNRSIESLELKQNLSRVSDIVGFGTGTTSNAITGSIKGGTGGALLAGGASLLDSGLSFFQNELLRKDALDLTKDQFGFNMGNIKALPYTLNNVSSFNNNNKLFPFIEYYTATDEEKQALREKMKYNGMTVGRIGTIQEFLKEEKTYIKGQLIRLENTKNNTHEVNDIANELMKGVFI